MAADAMSRGLKGAFSGEGHRQLAVVSPEPANRQTGRQSRESFILRQSQPAQVERQYFDALLQAQRIEAILSFEFESALNKKGEADCIGINE